MKKEQFHCVPCLVNSCVHTSDTSSQSVALVVDLVQPCFVIESSAFVLRCSCLDVSYAFLYVCYVQLQCTFSNVCACVRACVYVCIYIYIYICIYRYIQSGPKKCIHSLLINIFGINLNEISISG